MMLNANYVKLKTHLRLAIQRLKMAEKKKTELAQKSRKEIAEYLNIGKLERAKIRVEHIIREDYLVEAMGLVEMYCDLLITRFGLIEQVKTLDDGLAEAVSSLLWVAPRLQTDISEMKIVADLLTQKYGKQYAQAARDGTLSTISEKLRMKMAIEAPPKVLVEKYLIEIAKALNIDYEPDESVFEEERQRVESAKRKEEAVLIDFNELHNHDPMLPPQLPSTSGASALPPHLPTRAPDAGIVRPIGFDLNNSALIKKEFESLHHTNEDHCAKEPSQSPPPNYFDSISTPPFNKSNSSNSSLSGSTSRPNQPVLPNVPKSLPNTTPANQNATNDDDDNIDFDDLAKRFESLKKN